jgi:GNAT superfamily N-acetyltransferase
MSDVRLSTRPLASVANPSIRAGWAADGSALSRFLSDLSSESAYSRFLAAPAGTPSPRVLAALLPDRPRGGALLAFLDGELVGHGFWARLADSVAEIAIVVADRHQRRGIGTALVRATLDDLVCHGIAEVEVMSASDNRAVARMVAREAPDAHRALDGPTTTYTFAAPARSAVVRCIA